MHPPSSIVSSVVVDYELNILKSDPSAQKLLSTESSLGEQSPPWKRSFYPLSRKANLAQATLSFWGETISRAQSTSRIAYQYQHIP